jgi:hypothetical protein
MSNNKFESLLELLINEENDKAEALFHEIVVEKSRDIYENLADEEVTAEAMHDKKMKKEDEVTETETTEAMHDKKDKMKKESESEEANEEQVDEVVEIEDEATESETTEEESIEEVGGDATDELVKDISADEEGAKEMDMDMNKDMDMDKDMDMEKDMDKDGDEDMEDRVVDLEDALDELKAEFEAMMDKKDGDDEEKEDESLEVAPELTPEVEMEGKQTEAMHKDKGMKKEAMHKDKKEKMKEYKNPVKADGADHSDKSAKSPVNASVKSMGGGTHNIAKGGADETGRPAPTAQKMAGDFENTGGKAKSTSFKKMEKANTADGSDKSAKSPVASK